MTYFDGQRNIELTVVNDVLNNSGKLDVGVFFSDDDFKNGSALEDTLWAVETPEENTYIFSINTEIAGTPVVIQKIFKFHKSDYFFDLTYKVVNAGKKDFYLPSGKIIYTITNF